MSSFVSTRRPLVFRFECHDRFAHVDRRGIGGCFGAADLSDHISTAGSCAMIRSCWRMNSVALVSEMLGSVTGIHIAVSSSSGGMNSEPIEARQEQSEAKQQLLPIPASALGGVRPNAEPAHKSPRKMPHHRIVFFAMQPSRIRNVHRTGTSVTAMIVEPTIANVLVKASG